MPSILATMLSPLNFSLKGDKIDSYQIVGRTVQGIPEGFIRSQAPFIDGLIIPCEEDLLVSHPTRGPVNPKILLDLSAQLICIKPS